MADDLDSDLGVHPHCQCMPPARIQHLPVRRVAIGTKVMQRLVEISDARLFQVDHMCEGALRHARRFH